jgi:hypothetical protein
MALPLILTACGGGEGNSSSSTGTPAHETSSSPGASSCQSGAGDGAANQLENAGFENGEQPWITLAAESGFSVSSERARSGAASALLRMRDPAEASGARVYYLVQEKTAGELPEVVCGYYRAENWVKGSPHQYLQFVIIAFAPSNFDSTYENYQIRYLLAGADSPPFNIDNAKFVFVTRSTEPTLDDWVPFELNIREDFERMWGQAPEGFEKLRLLFEVRWDNKVAGAGASEADVYYDDLYAGPSG